jgi:hypothetical protein
MRSARLVFLGILLCLLTTAAFAEITSVSPSSISATTAETNMTIFGSGLAGNIATTVNFSSTNGVQVSVDTEAFSEFIVLTIPPVVAMTPGHYDISVDATDDTGVRHLTGGSFDVIEVPVVGDPIIFAPEFVVAEATSSHGASVFFFVSAQSAGGVPETPTCDHHSGDLFPLGSTFVSCSVTDSFGTAHASFEVFVADTTKPVLSIPTLVASPDPIVTFTATAVDSVDGVRPVTCSPPSGSTFAQGENTVTCEASDLHGNTAVGSFLVVISNTPPPPLNLPADITVEATGPDGAAVFFTPTTDADATVTCDHTSGATYPINTTNVVCTASRNSLSTTASFNITVVDTTAPTLTVPANFTTASTHPVFTTESTDVVDQNPVVTCIPPSGSTLVVGTTTTVDCTAVDFAGNFTQKSFTITVVADTTPPVLFLPGNITAEATSPAGAVVFYNATAVDDTDGQIAISCDHPTGSQFALGTTIVQCSATDTAGNQGTGSFNVTVVDTTPPTVNVPADITAEATSPAGATVNFTVTATDLVDLSTSVTCTPPSGSVFSLGTHVVSCSSTDSHGNTGHGSFNVTVVDTTPPTVNSITVSPSILWPDNHKMTEVTVSVDADDLVDPNPTSTIVSISSNQPVDEPGDGNTSPDWEITGALTANLRAERTAAQDRIYTITVATTDFSGNTTLSTVQVKVTPTKGRGVSH